MDRRSLRSRLRRAAPPTVIALRVVCVVPVHAPRRHRRAPLIAIVRRVGVRAKAAIAAV